MKTLLSAVALTLILGGPVAAQRAPSQGDRVRIVLASGERVTGTVEPSAPDTLSLAADYGASRVIAMSDVGALELSGGRHRRFARNLGFGVAGSAVVGGTLAAVTWSPCTDTGIFACLLHPESRSDALLMGLVGGAIIGLPVGLIAGLAITEERWEPVQLQASADGVLSIRPVIGPGTGAGFAATLTLGRP